MAHAATCGTNVCDEGDFGVAMGRLTSIIYDGVAMSAFLRGLPVLVVVLMTLEQARRIAAMVDAVADDGGEYEVSGGWGGDAEYNVTVRIAVCDPSASSNIDRLMSSHTRPGLFVVTDESEGE